MPISSAAMSMSRIAIHCRPMRPRTMLMATIVRTITIVSVTRYWNHGVAVGLGQRHTEQRAIDGIDGAGVVVVVEPGDPSERPLQEELRGKRGDGQVEALDAQPGQPEDDADAGCEKAREQNVNDDVHIRKDVVSL